MRRRVHVLYFAPFTTAQARTQVVEKVGYILVGMGFACASVPSRGVWGHAPPGKFWISRPSEIVSDAILE